jgi:hypothetical protein
VYFVFHLNRQKDGERWWRITMPVIVDGIQIKRVPTKIALIYEQSGRTRHYEAAAALKIKPMRIGNTSYWLPDDCDRIADWILQNAKPMAAA